MTNSKSSRRGSGSTTPYTANHKSLYREPEFEKQYVIGVKPVANITLQEQQVHTQLNRVLQPGFAVLGGAELLDLIRRCNNPQKPTQDWLTDYIQPTPDAALLLNIAAELVVNYEVSEQELQTKTQELFTKIYKELSSHSFFEKIPADVNAELNKNSKDINSRAEAECLSRFGNLDNLSDFIKLEQLKFGKQITNNLVSKVVNKWISENNASLNLNPKLTYPLGTNHDVTLLGAAGSGKSTLLKRMIPKNGLKQYVHVSTDVYRGVFMPAHAATEAIPTVQGVTRTQDSSYLIKELVQTRLEKAHERRPNVLVDAVSLEYGSRAILAQSIQNTVSAVACMRRLQDIPERVYQRALTATGAGDAGRHINTPFLISTHAHGSAQLLTSVPFGVKTMLYDTALAKGALAAEIAYIDTRADAKTFCIFDVDKVADFLGKTKANSTAESRIDLYKQRIGEMKYPIKYNFTYDIFNKAEQLIKLSVSDSYNKAGFHLDFADPKTQKKFLSITSEQLQDPQNGRASIKYNLRISPGQETNFLNELDKSDTLKLVLIQMYCANLQKNTRDELFIIAKDNLLELSKQHFGIGEVVITESISAMKS